MNFYVLQDSADNHYCTVRQEIFLYIEATYPFKMLVKISDTLWFAEELSSKSVEKHNKL